MTMTGAVVSAHRPLSPRQRGHLEALGLRLWQPWGLGSSYSCSPWKLGFDASEPASLHVAVHSLELGTLRNVNDLGLYSAPPGRGKGLWCSLSIPPRLEMSLGRVSLFRA